MTQDFRNILWNRISSFYALFVKHLTEELMDYISNQC